MASVYRPAFPFGAVAAARRRFVPSVALPVTPSTGTIWAQTEVSKVLTARLMAQPVLAARLKAVQSGE